MLIRSIGMPEDCDKIDPGSPAREGSPQPRRRSLTVRCVRRRAQARRDGNGRWDFLQNGISLLMRLARRASSTSGRMAQSFSSMSSKTRRSWWAMPMAVSGADIKAVQFIDVGQIIGKSGLQAGIEQARSLLANSESAFAAQGGEEMVEVRRVWQVSSHLLEKASPASNFMKPPQYSEGDPVFVRQLQADSRPLSVQKSLCRCRC